MLNRIKAEHDLTVLMTTHYMDEADKLCGRVAIVDHGHLMALDAPLKLKASIAGQNALEASFSGAPSDWRARLAALPGVESVSGDGGVFRLVSRSGPETTAALFAAAAAAGVTVQSLGVQSTTLDDVFVHFTGHELRDALQEATPLVRPVVFRQP
jgi:ABC-2 type transport system ATP-binding protein